MYMQKTKSVFVFGRVYFRHDMASRFRQHLRYFLKTKKPLINSPAFAYK